MSGIFLSIVYALFYSIIPATLWAMYSKRPHFLEEETKI